VNRPAAEAQVEAQKAVTAGETAIDKQRITIPVVGETMSIEERKMFRPDSRWKAEILNLYRTAEIQRSEAEDAVNIEYQTGVMMACLAVWIRVTGEQLV
jgi:hypothetical protein